MTDITDFFTFKIPVFIENMVDFMVIKRNGHQSNPDTIKLTLKSNHMCAILDNCGNPLMFGSNFFNITRGTFKSTEHAETAALTKLINKMGRTRRKITIDMLVIRTTKGNSLPCSNCMRRIHDLSQRFHIRYIYYTNNGIVERIKFSKC